MKTFLRFTAAGLFLFLFVTASFAQVPTTKSAKPAVNQNATGPAQRREAFERKKATVEGVQQRIDQINKKRTDQMTAFLDRLVKILEKIESRKEKAKAAGKDVSSVESAIKESKAKIEVARAAVKAQAEKSYTIEITGEPGLKNAVGKTISSLGRDLRKTHKIVIEAKQAVQKVFSLIKGIKGVDDAK